MTTTEIQTGVITANIPRQGLYQLTLNATAKVYLDFSENGGGGAPLVYDKDYRQLGTTPNDAVIQLDPGAYLVSTSFSGSIREIAAYIPSEQSYVSLQPLSTGTFRAIGYSNIYSLMLKEAGQAFISAYGGDAKIYDEQLNFIAYGSQAPTHLGAGNYVVIANYSSRTNGELFVNVPDSSIAGPANYHALSQIRVIEESNVFVGSSDGVDLIFGEGGDDRFVGGMNGNFPDRFFGGRGIDTSVYSGRAEDYLVSKAEFTGNPWIASGPKYAGLMVVDSAYRRDGTDYLYEVERLEFQDKKIALDIDGNAGKVAKILVAVFGQDALANKSYAGIGLGLLDGGTTYEDLADLAIRAAGVKTRESAVDLLWKNVMGTAPTAAQAHPFVEFLKPDLSNLGALGVMAGDYASLIGVVDLAVLSTTGLEFI